MSRNINELAEIVLDRVYKLGYQHRSEIEEGCKVADELLAVERKLGDAEREQDKLAAEIETLRQERDHWKQARQDAIQAYSVACEESNRLVCAEQDLLAEIDTLRQQLANAQREASDEFIERQVLTAEQHEGEAAWQQQLDAAQAEVVKLRTLNDALLEKDKRLRLDHARLGRHAEEEANAQRAVSNAFAEINLLREQLDAAQAALTRERLDAEERGEKLDRLREDHARLERLVQARGQEMEGQHQELVRLRGRLHAAQFDNRNLEHKRAAANAVVTLQDAEIKRLREFVKLARETISRTMNYCDVEFLLSALAQLDAGTAEPTPVTEPAPCPDWRAALAELDAGPSEPAPVAEPPDPDTRGQELERLRAFVAQVRSVVESEWYGLEMSVVRELLAQLDARTIKPIPVAEPIDEEDGQ